MSKNGARDDELNDLKRCDSLGDESWHANLHRAKEVVRVHEGVDDKVKINSVSVESWGQWMRVPGVDHGENMVIPVKEHEWTFTENQEDGVNKFEKFGSHEEPHPVSILSFREIKHFAVGCDNSFVGNGSKELWGHFDSSCDGKCGEDEIPDVEWNSQLEWLTITHEPFCSEHNDHVQD